MYVSPTYHHLFRHRAGPQTECGPMQAALRDYAVPIGCMVGIVHRGGSLRARPTWERYSPVPRTRFHNHLNLLRAAAKLGCSEG